MAVKVCVFFRPKNFSNIGALSLHSTYICTEMTSSTKKTHKKCFFLFFDDVITKKDRFLMTSLQKHPFLNDVITKKTLFDDVITTNFKPLFLSTLDLLRSENLGITISRHALLNGIHILPFHKLKEFCDTSWCWETPNRVLKYKM